MCLLTKLLIKVSGFKVTRGTGSGLARNFSACCLHTRIRDSGRIQLVPSSVIAGSGCGDPVEHIPVPMESAEGPRVFVLIGLPEPSYFASGCMHEIREMRKLMLIDTQYGSI
jgi:hypothetical protein